jgi:hypothetical protein
MTNRLDLKIGASPTRAACGPRLNSIRPLYLQWACQAPYCTTRLQISLGFLIINRCVNDPEQSNDSQFIQSRWVHF